MQILLIVIGLTVGIVLTLLAMMWITRKLQREEYEHDFIFLASCVRYWSVSEQTYNKIIRMFTELSLSKGNDEKRTKELWEEFEDRFSQFHRK